jgi:hypothetical protein
MTPEFLVSTTTRFERELHKLAVRHPGLADLYAQALEILRVDPHNRNRRHGIRKLTAVAAGEGQYRIRLFFS